MDKRICAVPDCESQARARGWCMKHYKRWYKHGDPTHVAEWSPPPQNRPRSFGCTVGDCDGRHFAKGFCSTHYQQDYHQRTNDQRLAYLRQYYRDNKAAIQAYLLEYRAKNREAIQEHSRAWYMAHREDQLEYRRQYRAENLERILELNRKRRALEKGVKVRDFTPKQWEEVKAEWGQVCAYCGKPRKLTVDHVVPLSKGGNHTKSNIVPACRSCNSKKGDREPLPFWFERSAA